MFSVPRNKKKPRVKKAIRTAASSSDDDNDDDEHHRRRNLGKVRDKKSKKKKKRGTPSAVGLSFDPEGEEGEDFGVSSSFKRRMKHGVKKSSKRSKRDRSGFGYGGGMMLPSDESASDVDPNQDHVHNIPSSQYDAAALQKLKKEQKHARKVVGDSTYDSGNKSIGHQKGEPTNNVNVEDDDEYISLAVVLTGDEALAFTEKGVEDPSEFDHGLESQPKQTKPEPNEGNNQMRNRELEEGNRQWEDTMTRRAGVLKSRGISQHNDARQQKGNKVTSRSSSMEKIRISLLPTMNNLETVSTDLASSIHRQQSQIYTTKDELTKHQRELQNRGESLEYYQGLRVDLATWIGALRELDSMIKLVEESRRRWEVDVTWEKLERFLQWGEDSAIVLEKQNLLETMIPCNDDDAKDQASEVDEFGRTVSSKAIMARLKRLDRRQRMKSERSMNIDIDQTCFCIVEDNFEVHENEELKQRFEALNNAAAFIPNSVKENFRSIANLYTLFLEWHRAYPEDYKTSFAQMSIVQMTSVLVRLEMSEKWDLLGLSRSSSADCQSRQYVSEISGFSWFQCLKSSRETKRTLVQIVQKEIFPRFMRSLSYYDDTKNSEKSTEHVFGVYNPFSADQTKHVCIFLKSIKVSMTTEETGTDFNCEKMIECVSGALLSLVRKCIERMKVSVLNPTQMKGGKNAVRDEATGFGTEIHDAITYASIVQSNELCTLATNIFRFWHPIISEKDGDLLRFVFTDIISLRLIPVVNTLHATSNEYNCKLAKTLIGNILDSVSGILDEEEWALQTASLRVAAARLNGR